MNISIREREVSGRERDRVVVRGRGVVREGF